MAGSRKASRAIEAIGQENLNRSESPILRGKTANESPVNKGLPPVTPGVRESGRSAYLETPGPAQSSSEDDAADADSYFPQNQAPLDPDQNKQPAKPTNELLNKLSLSRARPSPADSGPADPTTVHPNLNLSGRIISATFVVPFTVKSIQDNGWELGPRKGTSALFNSFEYLSSKDSKWEHTIVGWTGEIVQEIKNKRKFSLDVLTDSALAVLKAAAPIPVDSTQKAKIPNSGSIQISFKDRQSLERKLERHESGRVVPVWLYDDVDGDPEVYTLKDQRRWCRYSERELYNLFHYKHNEPSDGRSNRQSWADYYKLNNVFAERILEIYRPGDIVVVHDHQLMLLPSLLRQKLPGIYSGFFLHVPFPSSELYRCLSQRKEILEGMLGANMIGFQSYSFARHFSSCCTRILGFDSSSAGVDAYGAHVAVDVFPIGINATEIQQAAFEDSVVEEKIARIKQMYAGKKIIVGRDRLDVTRGVAQKLQAFEMFLGRYPEWRDKVVLIQINSSEQNPEQDKTDKQYLNKISGLVSHINGRYGSISSAPVKHFPQYIARAEYLALMRCADLGLITSVRDGMHTTSLEYVVCQKEKHSPLILSEFSGTAASLRGALLVNPWDRSGVADAINKALTMPEEERQRHHNKLYDYVINNDIRAWSNKFLNRLLTNLSSFDQSFATPLLDRAQVLQKYRAASKRLLMFDYDGTLTPIVQDPGAATPSDRVLRNLKKLSEDPANEVWIISGRDQLFLDEWMGHISSLGLSAEHGSFVRAPNSKTWQNVAEGQDMSWRDEVQRIFGQYTERTQGSFIETKKVALTWHYRKADPEYGAYQARECAKVLEAEVARKWDVEVMAGKANLEVRPRFVNKGEIARRLVAQYNITQPSSASSASASASTTIKDETENELGFVICAGDDFTDEDMFRSLRQSKTNQSNIFTVTVGASSKQTLAAWHLLEPSDVISLLGLMNGVVDQGNIGAVGVVDGKVPDLATQRD